MLPLFSVSPLSSGHDSIYYLHDAVQGGVSANGHVSTTEVVVDGAHKAYDVQMVVLLCQSVCDPSWVANMPILVNITLVRDYTKTYNFSLDTMESYVYAWYVIYI